MLSSTRTKRSRVRISNVLAVFYVVECRQGFLQWMVVVEAEESAENEE